MYVGCGTGSVRGPRARRLPAAAAARLAGGVAPARGPRERRRRSARGAHAPTWTVPPGPGGTWRDRRDLGFWRDLEGPQSGGCLFRAEEGPTKVGVRRAKARETSERHGAGGNSRARRRRSAATGSAFRRRHREARRLQRAARGASRGARAWDGGAGAASAASRRRASVEHRRGGRRFELPAGPQERREAGEAGAQEGEGGGGGAARCSATGIGRRCVQPSLEGQPLVVTASDSEDSESDEPPSSDDERPAPLGRRERTRPTLCLAFGQQALAEGAAAAAGTPPAPLLSPHGHSLSKQLRFLRRRLRVRGRADSCRRRCHDVRRG